MSDLISRQAAIERLREFEYDDMTSTEEAIGADYCVDIIRTMPSAQLEIIRCRDCKHSERWYRDRRRCFLWVEDGIDVFDDGFCNYADWAIKALQTADADAEGV